MRRGRIFAGLAVLAGLALASIGFASASQLGVTSASLTSLTATVAQPPALGLSITNGGSIAGRPEDNDVVRVTYPAGLDISTMCPSAPNGTTVLTLDTNNAVTVTITNGGASNDTLSITTTCPGWVFGTINLGGTGYVSSNATFRGSGSGRSILTYTPSTGVLAVTLGARASGTATTMNTTKTAVYTPAAALEWQDGNTVAPSTGVVTGRHF